MQRYLDDEELLSEIYWDVSNHHILTIIYLLCSEINGIRQKKTLHLQVELKWRELV